MDTMYILCVDPKNYAKFICACNTLKTFFINNYLWFTELVAHGDPHRYRIISAYSLNICAFENRLGVAPESTEGDARGLPGEVSRLGFVARLPRPLVLS